METLVKQSMVEHYETGQGRGLMTLLSMLEALVVPSSFAWAQFARFKPS